MLRVYHTNHIYYKMCINVHTGAHIPRLFRDLHGGHYHDLQDERGVTANFKRVRSMATRWHLSLR